MSSTPVPLLEAVSKFEAELGIREGFLRALLDEGDDWSFVIKINALVETAINYALTTVVGQRALDDLLTSRPMGDSRQGKITLAKNLELLDPRRVTFLRAVGRIRNKFAHEIRHVGLTIAEFIGSLELPEQEQMWQALIQGYTVEPTVSDFEGRKMAATDFARGYPRFTIWISTLTVLALLYHTKNLDGITRGNVMVTLTTMKPLPRKL